MVEKNYNSIILSVETSGRTGSVAAGIGDEILVEATFSGIMRHSAELFPNISAVLTQIGKKSHDVDHVYISAGPGSFTGLRIAVTMAKIMAFAGKAKIVPVSTMDVIAEGANSYIKDKNVEIKRIATILDAKRKQFYAAVFEKSNGRWSKTMKECLLSSGEFIEQFATSTEPIWLLGEGLVYYKDAFTAEGVRFLDEKYWPATARATYLVGRTNAKAGKFADADRLVPLYLRSPEAVKKSG